MNIYSLGESNLNIEDRNAVIIVGLLAALFKCFQDGALAMAPDNCLFSYC